MALQPRFPDKALTVLCDTDDMLVDAGTECPYNVPMLMTLLTGMFQNRYAFLLGMPGLNVNISPASALTGASTIS